MAVHLIGQLLSVISDVSSDAADFISLAYIKEKRKSGEITVAGVES